MGVPFLDMSRMHDALSDELTSSFKDILRRSAFVNGPEVKSFEEAFAKWVGTKYCVGVASGLDAEVIGLRCMGIKPGDRVVVPAMTFIATVEAVTAVGAVPVLVDVDSEGLMNLDQADAALRAGAKYVLPVHLFGQLMDPVQLKALADRHGAKILEDACQAHGAKLGEVRAGTLGQVSAFSFYPGKNLGALGDGGALCTNDPEIDRMARALREHGQTKKYFHQYEGYTSRLDNLQAAFLNTKLKHMDAWTEQRISAARYYAENLGSLKNFSLQSRDNFKGRHVYHLFVGLTDRREQLSEELKKAEIGFGYHYPIPIHQLACYENSAWAKGSFPNSEKFAQQGISLPMFPGIRREELDAVIAVVRKTCG